MQNQTDLRYDMLEIERRAHALRAEVARDGVRSFGKWLRAHLHFGTGAVKHA